MNLQVLIYLLHYGLTVLEYQELLQDDFQSMT